MADDNDLPRSPTHHSHILDHDHDHKLQHEISAAVALDNVNTSRKSSFDNASLGESSSGRVGTGHERGFVQPASYLRRRGLSHPMAPSQPERAVDAEEQMGLVSRSCSLWRLLALICAFFFLSVWFIRGVVGGKYIASRYYDASQISSLTS